MPTTRGLHKLCSIYYLTLTIIQTLILTITLIQTLTLIIILTLKLGLQCKVYNPTIVMREEEFSESMHCYTSPTPPIYIGLRRHRPKKKLTRYNDAGKERIETNIDSSKNSKSCFIGDHSPVGVHIWRHGVDDSMPDTDAAENTHPRQNVFVPSSETNAK